jgi:hypothetical protein
MNSLPSDRQKYFEERSRYNDRSGSKIHIKNRHIEEFRKLELGQERKQEEIIEGKYRGKGILLDTIRTEQKQERDLLKRQQAKELVELKVEPFLEFDQWWQQIIENRSQAH